MNRLLHLNVDDWLELRTSLWVLRWQHMKKGEENLAVLPALIAQHLQLYVDCTASIRAVLGTERVFLSGNNQGFWEVMEPRSFHLYVETFTKKHHLTRDGVALSLGSTLFRRTYVTRALSEGQRLEALRSQLGHATVETTLIYSKFDRFEHPAHVRASLDAYGRQALVLWRAPLLLSDLDNAERETLLGVKEQRQQGVGLCRHSHCVKADGGGPPPCSLCEHLITGEEFLAAWKAEQTWREQELKVLIAKSESDAVCAQMQGQFEHFQANFVSVQERSTMQCKTKPHEPLARL